MNEYENMEIGWDDEISNDGSGFILLPEGDYDFTVTKFERDRYPGSAKIPPCPKAVLVLNVSTPEGEANIKYDLIMSRVVEWKLSEFFRGIGQKKHGEAFTPNWNAVVGETGRCHVTIREYTNKQGDVRKTNDVSKFYDKQPAAAPAAFTPGRF